MALIRWEPARELSSLQGEMNRLFNTFFDTPAAGNTGMQRWVPAMDLVEGEDHYLLRADLPGMDESDVNVELDDNVLSISGERKEETRSERQGFHRIERATGAFRRTLTLPEGVDAEAIAASFDKGVLEIRIPKPAERKPRKVEIGVGSRPATIEGSAAE